MVNEPGYIYMIVNKHRDAAYVGQTTVPRHRFYRHRYLLTQGRHDNPKLQQAWNKYGADAFSFEIVETVPRTSLTASEQVWMDSLPLWGFEPYNLCPAAESRKGVPHNPEVKARIADSSRGRVVSVEVRERMAQAQQEAFKRPERIEKHRLQALGRRLTPETIEKRSKARQGWKPSPEHLEKLQAARREVGCTPETKAKISCANTGKKRSEESRRKMSEAAKARRRRKTTSALVTEVLTKPERV